jgi:hypothetical protein
MLYDPFGEAFLLFLILPFPFPILGILSEGIILWLFFSNNLLDLMTVRMAGWGGILLSPGGARAAIQFGSCLFKNSGMLFLIKVTFPTISPSTAVIFSHSCPKASVISYYCLLQGSSNCSCTACRSFYHWPAWSFDNLWLSCTSVYSC